MSQVCVCALTTGLPPRAPSIRSWYNISMIAAAAAAVDSGNFERGSLTLRMGMRMSRWREREREREIVQRQTISKQGAG